MILLLYARVRCWLQTCAETPGLPKPSKRQHNDVQNLSLQKRTRPPRKVLSESYYSCHFEQISLHVCLLLPTPVLAVGPGYGLATPPSRAARAWRVGRTGRPPPRATRRAALASSGAAAETPLPLSLGEPTTALAGTATALPFSVPAAALGPVTAKTAPALAFAGAVAHLALAFTAAIAARSLGRSLAKAAAPLARPLSKAAAPWRRLAAFATTASARRRTAALRPLASTRLCRPLAPLPASLASAGRGATTFLAAAKVAPALARCLSKVATAPALRACVS